MRQIHAPERANLSRFAYLERGNLEQCKVWSRGFAGSTDCRGGRTQGSPVQWLDDDNMTIRRSDLAPARAQHLSSNASFHSRAITDLETGFYPHCTILEFMIAAYVTTRLLVADYPLSLRFYRDTLGLPVAQTIGEGNGVYCELGADGGRIALYAREMFADSVLTLPAPSRGDAMLIALEVGDLEAVAAQLEGAADVKLEAGITERKEWALRTLHLRDPDGNLIELFERI